VGALAPLGDRRFRLLFAAETVSRFGDGLVGVALAFAVLDLTRSPRDLSFVLLAQTLPNALLIYVGGVWADRVSRRALIVGSYLVGLGCYATLAALLLSGQARLWQFLVLFAVRGVANAFSTPSHLGLVTETVEPAQLQQATALVQLSTNVARIAGPAAAGAIVALSNPGWAFALDAATFVPATVLLLAIGPLVRRERTAGSFRTEFAEGLREVRGRVWLLASLLSGTLVTLVAIPAENVVGPLVAKQSLGGAAAWSAIVAAWSAGTALGSALSLRLRPRRPLAVCFSLGFVFGALPLLLLAAPAPTAAIAAAQFANGVGGGLFFSLEATLLQQHVARGALSRVTALHYGTWTVVAPLGLALVAGLVGAIGPTATLVAAAAAAFLANGLSLALRDVRRVEWLQVPEAPPLAAAVDL
jgi:MFS family permease